jgi:FAD binding domain of DNA photolyase
MRYIAQIVGRKFDPEGEYVKKWVPELKDVPNYYIHRPWKMSEEQQTIYNARLGIDYPHPIRDPNVGDERRKYRFLRRKGMEIPPDLEENVKTRIMKDLNRDYGGGSDNDDYSGEEEDHDDDDERDDDDGDDDEEEEGDDDDDEEDDYDEEEDDYDDEEDERDEEAGNEIENEVMRKMNTSKSMHQKNVHQKNVDNDWYRDLKDGKLTQETTGGDKPNQDTTNDSNSKNSITPEPAATKPSSSTKNKWRINL